MNFKSLFALSSVLCLFLGGAAEAMEAINFIAFKENCPPTPDISPSPEQVGGAQFTRRSVGNKFVGDEKVVSANGHNTIVFFITAPHDQENRGDTDYVRSVMRGIKGAENSFDVEYVRGGSKKGNDESLYDVEALYRYNSEKKSPEYQIENSPTRQSALINIISYINEFKYDHKILHLQLRAPETGCMIHEEELGELKKLGKLIVTCHEFSYFGNSENSRHNQARQLLYLKQADHVIFLNELDRQRAVQVAESGLPGESRIECYKFEGLLGKSSVSNISSTVPTSKDLNLQHIIQKPPNVLIFGLIRPRKGFEEAIELAKKIKDLDKDKELASARVVIAGIPHDYKLVRSLILAKYGEKSEFVKNMDHHIEEVIAQKCRNYSLPLGDITQRINNKIPKNFESVPNQFKTSVKICALVDFLKLNATDNDAAKIPVDLHFDVDNNELDELASKCKFCVKLEDKCFANNSSSIINALHRGLITFSGGGDITSNDFKENGIFSKAINLCWNIDKEQRIDHIMNTMEEIQAHNYLVEPILNDMQKCISGLFSDKKIGADHLRVYQQFLETSYH